MRELWGRLPAATKVPLLIGVVFAAIGGFLPTFVALVLAAFAAAMVGYLFPTTATRAGILVALPVIAVAYLLGLIRGFSGVWLAVFLLPSFAVPVALARIAASVRGADRI